MNRIQWLERNRGRELLNKLVDDRAFVYSEQEAIEKFTKADPSIRKRYTAWLIETYLAGGFRAEDITRAGENLQLFMKNLRHLPVEQRDIRSYKKLSDLWINIKQFAEADAPISGKEEKRREKEEAYANSIILRDDDVCKVAIPLNIKAAKWWGRGTQWCTSAENDNAFWSYHKRGPLVVFVFADGTKLQLFGPDNQFMNENDAAVEYYVLQEKWDVIYPVLKAVMAQPDAGAILELLPPKLRTPELCALAVKSCPSAVFSVPKEHMTRTMIAEALSQNGSVINCFNSRLLDEGLCEAAVRQCPHIFSETPVRLRSKNLCELVVALEPTTIPHVPFQHVTEDLVLKAIRSNGTSLGLLLLQSSANSIAVRFHEDDVIVTSIHTKDELKLSIPAPELIDIAVRAGGSMAFIPDRFGTTERLDIVAETNPFSLLSYRPYEVTTDRILKAFKADPALLPQLPPHHFTDQLISVIKETGGSGLFQLPKDKVDDTVLLGAANKDPSLISQLPSRLQSPDLLLKMVEHDPNEIFSLHRRDITKEISSVAFALDKQTFGAIPDEFRTEAMFVEASAHNIFWADKHSRQLQERCVAAYENNPANRPDWLSDQTLLQALKATDWEPESTVMKLAS